MQSARTATDVDVMTFVGPSNRDNYVACMAFIREAQLARNQIIAITAAETIIIDGEQALFLVYRETSIAPNSLPCDTVQYFEYDYSLSWDDLLLQGQNSIRGSSGIEVMGFSRSAKNLGNGRTQVLWYNRESSAAGSACFHEIKRSDGDFNALATQVKDWLNAYIPPHMFAGVTIHEDAHPNASGVVRAVITHYAGASPTAFKDVPESAGALPQGGLYTLYTLRGEIDGFKWQDVMEKTKNLINSKGGQEGWAVSAANSTANDGAFVAIFSWQALYEYTLADVMRPAGCCTLF